MNDWETAANNTRDKIFRRVFGLDKEKPKENKKQEEKPEENPKQVQNELFKQEPPELKKEDDNFLMCDDFLCDW